MRLSASPTSSLGNLTPAILIALVSLSFTPPLLIVGFFFSLASPATLVFLPAFGSSVTVVQPAAFSSFNFSTFTAVWCAFFSACNCFNSSSLAFVALALGSNTSSSSPTTPSISVAASGLISPSDICIASLASGVAAFISPVYVLSSSLKRVASLLRRGILKALSLVLTILHALLPSGASPYFAVNCCNPCEPPRIASINSLVSLA